MSIDFRTLAQKQHTYFKSGATRSYKFRIEQLKAFRAAIKRNEQKLNDALYADLNKSPHEIYMTEIGPALSELRFIKNHLKQWMKPKPVPGMLFSFPSSGEVIREPYGTALIISPWNYPFWLSTVPVIGAMAAGNCVILKPSELTSNTSSVMKKMFEETFSHEYFAVVEGDAEVSRQLINLPPDYIFFTGSTRVGKIVAQSAARNLIPFTLELGSKSPCIIDETANIKLSVRRMMWGKAITSGQTCVAPDYLLVHEKIINAVVSETRKVLEDFYPGGALNDPHYPCIINEKNYSRLIHLMESGNILLGGKTDAGKRKIEPTLLGGVSLDDAVMKEEIFGSLLPVISFNSVEDVIQAVNHNPNPLSLYIFSKNKKFQRRLLQEISFGGALINDTIEHLGNHYLPFGGIGGSGLGAYHGKFSFDAFSHKKAVMNKGTWIDLNFRYKPYSSIKEKVMRAFLR